MDDLEAALESLRPALDADGFDLKIDSVEPEGRVHVGLEARADACHDCLVPDDVLKQILETSIKEKRPDITEVVLEKHGFA